ncbi:MAG: UDP-N-acetylmuramoyl-L-alanine--D-glutamate ligase [Candidatus Pelagibacter sp.]|nr:UDP-N-acetylmuramoyl-L-alanine--D-glutamate ligase [Candidatus Pelagibacter sp.]
MFALQKYQYKKVAVYGMGITGYSAAKAFRKLNAEVYCWDDNKKVRRKIKNSKFLLSKFWLNKNLVDIIIISPGIDINKSKIKNYLKKNSNKIITDLDLFFEFNKDATIISITGTNGKSTTCKIIEKILKMAQYNVKTVGNIGNPILSSIKPKKKYIFILEASSYQLQYSKLFRSKHAAILNISPDHLERHKNINNYIKIKSRIFFAQKSSDYSYINMTNKHSKSIESIFKTHKLKSKLISIDRSSCNLLLKKIDNKFFKSKGNIENLAFAYKIVKNLKVNDKIIIKALNEFKGLPHRQEIVFSNNKLLCVNDSKATTFEASLQSLLNYNNIYWIVGGLPKYRDYFHLRNVKKKVLKAYIVGKKTSFFKRQIENDIPCTISKNIRNAINNIYKDIKLNKNLKETILLSPGAASFDQFNNFEDRGNFFKKLVLKKFKRRLNV